MTPRSEKFNYLYWPFVAILFACIGGYSLLHWLLVVVLKWSDPSSVVSHWVFPIIMMLSVTLIFFYERVNLLEGKKKDRNDKTGYLIAIVFVVIGPMVSSQYLLLDIAGQRRELTDPAEVLNQQGARYYTIKDHKADRYNTYRREFITYSSGRKKNTQNTLVIVLPAYAKKDFPAATHDSNAWPVDTSSRAFGAGSLYAHSGRQAQSSQQRAHGAPVIWLCWMYDTSISQQISDLRQKAAMERFVQHSIDDFQKHDPDDFTYLLRPANNDDRLKMEVAVREALGNYSQTPFVVMPVYEPYHKRYSSSMWYFVSFTAAALIIWLLQLVTVKVDKKEWQKYVAARRRPPLRGATKYN